MAASKQKSLSSRSISCTLLIPGKALFRRLRYDGAPMANWVDYLLRRYGHDSRGRQFVRPRGTTGYQKAGCSLNRVDFRVTPALWHQLGCHARVLGVSRCRAFVMLLERHFAGESAGTPPQWPRKKPFLVFFEAIDLTGRYLRGTRKRRYVDDPALSSLIRWVESPLGTPPP